ncbi:uncharacterized protein LOC143046499 [Mytilus galloprovincialis]|uniref:uncharacterized protein LOC143046499 n=1 Tax=Mytilus galloprovincialis TaxID=29158 RepID=UPI003F7C8243
MQILHCFRIRGTDTFFCSTFFYDGSTDPVTFAVNDVDPDNGLITFENKTDEFKDICEVCKFPSIAKLLFVESGAPRPNDPDVDCNLPSYCEPSESCTSCAVCKNDGNVPKVCKKKRCRDSFKRKGFNNKKTFWKRRYRKSLKMKGKRAKSWLYGKRYT